MDESQRLIRAARTIAETIARRDIAAIEKWLAPGFVHRTPGGDTQDAETFANAILNIPGDIVFVRLDNLEVDISDAGALVTGIQHAQVRIDDTTVDDRRAFVDWFVKEDGDWRMRVAIDLPVAAGA